MSESSPPLKRVHLWISGQVQGVGYRVYTQKVASRLQLNGWVRNLSDGRVEAVFEGSPQQVDAMVHECHTGSPSARVTQVLMSTETPEGLTTFEIKPTQR